jgi:hypothetical protein
MNYKTNFYGLVGLASTIGKNGFALGEKASGLSKNVCYYVRTNIVEIDLAVIGPVFEKLENTFENIKEFDKSTKT